MSSAVALSILLGGKERLSSLDGREEGAAITQVGFPCFSGPHSALHSMAAARSMQDSIVLESVSIFLKRRERY